MLKNEIKLIRLWETQPFLIKNVRMIYELMFSDI